MALNALRHAFDPSPKRAVNALRKLYAAPLAAQEKQARAQTRVDTYLGHQNEKKVLSHARSLLDTTLAKPNAGFGTFLVDGALVPMLRQQSPKFNQAEALMEAMNIEALYVDATVGTLRGVAVGFGFTDVDAAPVEEAMRAVVSEGKAKYDMALTYAQTLSTAALDAAVQYCSTPTGQHMMRKLPTLSGDLMQSGLLDTLRSDATLSEKRQRKVDKLEQLLRLNGSDIGPQCVRMGVAKNAVLARMAKSFSEADLDACIAWQSSPSGAELLNVQRGLKGGWPYLNRSDVQKRLADATQKMMDHAKRADPWDGLLGRILRMR